MENEKRRRPPLDNKEAARYTGLTAGYLNKLRVSGGGPIFIKIGGRILYAPDDLDTWLDAHKRTSTSDGARNAA